MIRTSVVALGALVALTPALAAQQGKVKEPQKPPAAPPPAQDTLIVPQALQARAIGPATMGGRVSTIAFDPKDPYTYYVGLATGGLMKTTTNGQSFQAIFEHEATASSGDVAVAPSDPSVVWYATGEGNDRNTVTWGTGVYRSTDAGATWTNVGLKNSKVIARIVVHPSDPKTAWAAVGGDLWADSPERGVYKTTDAGATWKKVLGAAAPYDTKVGAGDIAIDPADPNVLYAALYARRRRPWEFLSGASFTDGKDLGGIFKSADGGATWTKLTNGLPARTQRIGLAVYAKNPNVVYAVVQSDAAGMQSIDDPFSKAGGVFRSDDAGATWKRMSALDPRPFYFSQIRVDPTNDQRVYVLGYMVHASEDGGRTWREDRFKNVHPDNHALAIDPRNPAHLLLGTDGGLYASFDRAATWGHQARIAAGEFFRVSVDDHHPYHICGGLQDNTNWVGPSATNTKDGIVNADWTPIGGGDGSWCAFDPSDANIVYAESQQGYIFRFNLATGEAKDLREYQTEGQPAFRFNWTSPFFFSRHSPGTIYHAGNRVFKLTDHGDHFTVISPDLSTRDYERMAAVGSGAEDFGGVYTLAESPVKAGMLWAGTDDGKLWRTDDAGGVWTDLSASLPAAVKGLWISRVAPSAHDANVAYLAIDGHRTGNYGVFLYRTADGGKTWQSIATNLPAEEPVKTIVEDPKNANLLFAGTERNLYISVDRGARWQRFGGLPTVAVDDIVIPPNGPDLLVATHGRSLYIVDDIRPLEEVTPEVLREDAHLFTIRADTARYRLPGWSDWAGSAGYRGQNPPEGALITFWVRRWTGDEVSIAITDAAGTPVANLKGPGTPGLNRVTWDYRPTKDLLTPYGGAGTDKFVHPGEYTVTLTYGKTKLTQKVQVVAAPGIETR